MPINKDLILYLDCEMTGNRDDDEIIEVGLVMLDSKTLDELGAFSIVVEPSEMALDNLSRNAVVNEMHNKNGLIQDLMSSNGCPAPVADDLIVKWINKFTTSTNHIPYGGSGISHFDRKYIDKDLPRLSRRITYWSYDIGGARRLWRLAGRTDWLNQSDKTHRALDDARQHADELRWFVQQVRG